MNVNRYARYIHKLLEERFGLYRWEDLGDGTCRVTPLVPRQCGDVIDFLKGEDITARREGGSVVLSGFALAASRHAATYVTKFGVIAGNFMEGKTTQQGWRQLARAYWRVCIKYGIDDLVAAAVDPLSLQVRVTAAAEED